MSDERLRRLVRDLDELIDTMAPPSGGAVEDPRLLGYIAQLATALREELTRRHRDEYESADEIGARSWRLGLEPGAR